MAKYHYTLRVKFEKSKEGNVRMRYQTSTNIRNLDTLSDLESATIREARCWGTDQIQTPKSLTFKLRVKY